MARWHTCNVLQNRPAGRDLWQFHFAGEHPKLVQRLAAPPGDPLPARLIVRDWQALYRKKLNVALLPPDKVFLRTVQIPAADATEAQSMIELQLEKLSPLPVQQVVWTFELLPGVAGTLRNAIVAIAPRDYIEEFLGKLEGDAFLADRLELTFIDELLATRIEDDGAWIYPGLGVDQRTCLVAWWYGGVLHNLAMLHVPAGESAGAYLRGQLAQMAWAGEMDGWLTSPPRWRLVAASPLRENWEPLLHSEETPIEVVNPVAVDALAALTARRAAMADGRVSLVPPEYLQRYRQQFIDRIWMRGLGAVLLAYIFGVLIYMGALQVLKFKYSRTEAKFSATALTYTNALKLRAEVEVLQEQIDLQFAALECWKAAATLLPPELQMDSLTFEKGRTLRISGTGPTDAAQKVADYSEALSRYTVKDQPFFAKVSTPDTKIPPNQGLRWNLTAELVRKTE